MDSNRYRPIYFGSSTCILTVFLLILAAVRLAADRAARSDLPAVPHAVDRAVAPAVDLAARRGVGQGLARAWARPGAVRDADVRARRREQRVFVGSFVVGLILVGLVGMNLVIPRFFCRVLCPLGALLGRLLAVLALCRIDRDLHKCTDCDLCLKRCEGASDPQAQLRKSECFVCFNCIDDCPEDALSFTLPVSVTDRTRQVDSAGPKLSARRQLVLLVPRGRASLALAARPARTTASNTDENSRAKADPAAGLGRGARVPANAASSATSASTSARPTCSSRRRSAEAGLEGLWTPVMDFTIGSASSTARSAARSARPARSRRSRSSRSWAWASSSEQGPIVLGTAFFDRGRCLPWAMEIPVRGLRGGLPGHAQGDPDPGRGGQATSAARSSC